MTPTTTTTSSPTRRHLGTAARIAAATAAAALAVAGLSTPPASAAPAASPPTHTVDADATPATRSLLSYLHGSAAAGRILFGHQNDLTESVNGPADGNAATSSDVHTAVGKYPAVMGLSTTDPASMASATEQAFSHNMIVTVDDHMNNFTTGKGFGDLTTTIPYILPGGKDNAAFTAHLDQIATFANTSRTPDGTAIPVIYRPFHENNGSWFWWGATNSTKQEYRNLWRYTVEYLRDVKGVHNLLYAYSPNGHFTSTDDYLQRWPGDDYVDVVGFDTYYDSPQADTDPWFDAATNDAKIAAAVAQSKNKVAAMTEFGVRWNSADGIAVSGNKVTNFFTRLAAELEEAHVPLAYMMTWRNQSFNLSEQKGFSYHFFTPYAAFTTASGKTYPDNELLPDFRAFAADPNIGFADPAVNIFGIATTPGAKADIGYLMSPLTSNSVSYSGTLTLRAKAIGTADAVSFTAGGRTIVGTYNPADGYWEATWDSASTADGTATVTATIRFPSGDQQDSSTITVKNGTTVTDPGLIDDFGTYGTTADLATVWQRNVNGGSADTSLVPQLTGNGHAMRVVFTPGTPGYAGVQRATRAVDWSTVGSDLHITITNTGGGSKSLTLQAATDTGTYAATLSSAGYQPDTNATQTLTVPLSAFIGLEWSNPSTPTISGTTTAFAIYSSNPADIAVDNIRVGSAPVSATPTLQVSNDQVLPGGSVQVTGHEFPARTDVEVWLHSTPTKLATLTTQADGSFTATVTVPRTATPGTHELTAERNGTQLASVPLSVTAPTPAPTPSPTPDTTAGGTETDPTAADPTGMTPSAAQGTLAWTGADTSTLIALSAVSLTLMLAGAAALARRRRQLTPTATDIDRTNG